MLSGVGPKEHLLSKDIPCILDSPMVGQNLQEHAIVPIPIYGDEPEQQSTVNQFYGTIDYLANRQGYLTENAISSGALSFYSTVENATFLNCENQISILPKNFSTLNDSLTLIFRYNEVSRNSIIELNKNHALYFIFFTLLHPFSRGNISLTLNNPSSNLFKLFS